MKGNVVISSRKRNAAYALILGVIIFILGLIITFSEVHGVE